MSEEIKQLGEMFRSKRQEMNLSLKEVENATSIRSGYLEAIEEGNVSQFISAIYAQGFMKQYGSFLGIDIDRIFRDHPDAFRFPEEKHDFAYGIGTLEMRGGVGGGAKWLPNLLWVGLAVGVLGLGWYLAKFLGIF